MAESVQNIAFILDGNRRWAKEKGLPTLMGHKVGIERLEDCARWVRDRGIPHMAAYVFSTENWNREPEEVNYLMELFHEAASERMKKLLREGVAIRCIGNRALIPITLQKLMQEVEENSPEKPAITLWIAISYGSRAEIAAAASNAARAGGEVTEESLQKHFWSAGMPDPDIIVRTGGERRLSNFLLWQAAYSELFFTHDYWPDFSEKKLDEILAEYAERERRYGT